MSGWKSSSGLSDDTALVKLYPSVNHKEEWQEEAEERDTSLSRYLQELIQEARYLRRQGQLKLGDRRKVEELQEEIEELETQLENRSTQQVTPESTGLVDEELVADVLSENYQSLDQLLQELVTHPEFQRQVRLDLETALYSLGDDAEAVFRRGKGWKTSDGGDQ